MADKILIGKKGTKYAPDQAGKPFANKSSAESFMQREGISGEVIQHLHGFVIQADYSQKYEERVSRTATAKMQSQSTGQMTEVAGRPDTPPPASAPNPIQWIEPSANNPLKAPQAAPQDSPDPFPSFPKKKARNLTPEESQEYLNSGRDYLIDSGYFEEIKGAERRQREAEAVAAANKPKRGRPKKAIERGSISSLFSGGTQAEIEYEERRQRDRGLRSELAAFKDYSEHEGEIDSAFAQHEMLTQEESIFSQMKDEELLSKHKAKVDSKLQKQKEEAEAQAKVVEAKAESEARAKAKAEAIAQEKADKAQAKAEKELAKKVKRDEDLRRKQEDEMFSTREKEDRDFDTAFKQRDQLEFAEEYEKYNRIREGQGLIAGLRKKSKPTETDHSIFDRMREKLRILDPAKARKAAFEEERIRDDLGTGGQNSNRIFDPDVAHTLALKEDSKRSGGDDGDTPQQSMADFIGGLKSSAKALGILALTVKAFNSIAQQTTKEREEAMASGTTQDRQVGLLNQFDSIRRGTANRILTNLSSAGQQVQRNPSAIGGIISQMATANALSGGAELDFGGLTKALLSQDTTEVFNILKEHADKTKDKFGEDEVGAAKSIASVGGVLGAGNIGLLRKGKLVDKDGVRSQFSKDVEHADILIDNAIVSLKGGDFAESIKDFHKAVEVLLPKSGQEAAKERLNLSDKESSDKANQVLLSNPYGGQGYAGQKFADWLLKLFDDSTPATRAMKAGQTIDNSRSVSGSPETNHLNLTGTAVIDVVDKSGKKLGEAKLEQKKINGGTNR